MFLFVHDCFETANSFLTTIRTLFDLSIDNYDDRFILDTFCVKIPGYDKDDSEFEYDYIKNKVLQLILDKKLVQQELATKLIIGSKAGSTLGIMREDECTLVGHGTGCAICLSLSIDLSDNISNMVLLDVSNYYNNWKFILANNKIQNLIKKSNSQIEDKIFNSQDTAFKSFLSLLLENSNQKGVLGFLDFAKNYDFGNVYNRLEINQKNEFSKISILAINSNKSRYGSRDIQKLNRIINPKKNFLNKQHHTVVMIGSKTNIDHAIIKQKNYNMLLDASQADLCDRIRVFFNN
jgi:hypothetical protein